MKTAQRNRVPALLSAGLLLWLAGAIVASSSGWLGSLSPMAPPRVAGLTIVISAMIYYLTPQVRAYFAGAGLRRLTWVHVLRIAAVPLFFWYGNRGLLPQRFVESAAWGDLAAGCVGAGGRVVLGPSGGVLDHAHPWHGGLCDGIWDGDAAYGGASRRDACHHQLANRADPLLRCGGARHQPPDCVRPAAAWTQPAESRAGKFEFAGGAMNSDSGSTAEAQRMTGGPCTHILVSLQLRSDADVRRAMAMMREEMVATAKLYLEGKIQQWFSQVDERGVMFLFGTSDVLAAERWIGELPLVSAGLVELSFTRLGPLLPLGTLLGVLNPA